MRKGASADDDDRAGSQDKAKAIPEWAEGLYYNKGIFSEALVYHDDESIYFECRGKDDGVVRYTFEMMEGLRVVEEEEHEASAH